MRYLLKCSKCGATCWVSGNYQSDTNALSLGDPPEEWDGHEGAPFCGYEDFEVIDEEYPGPHFDDVL